MGHGISDLSPKEQAAYANRPRLVIEVPKVQQQFVRVPGPDHDAQGFRDAIAREMQANPQFSGVLGRVMEGARLVADGLRTKERLFGSDRTPAEVITQ
ncbi:MAG: hypothetical protein AB7G28_20785 [Pirellulales bacterium]